MSQVRRYVKLGPIVLVSSALDDRCNVMTIGWHTVMEFTPSPVGCRIADSNYSFDLIRKSRDCVINLPTTVLTDTEIERKLGDGDGFLASAVADDVERSSEASTLNIIVSSPPS